MTRNRYDHTTPIDPKLQAQNDRDDLKADNDKVNKELGDVKPSEGKPVK